MSRSELLLATGGTVLLACGAMMVAHGQGPMRDLVLDGGPACPAAPVRVLEPQGIPARGSVVMFHGLAANHVVMLTPARQFAAAGFHVYIPDLPGHGANPAPFSFGAAEACAKGLLAALERRGDIAATRTVLLGHSMGAALVVRLADDFLAAGTIAVATAPLVRPHRIPANLLLVAPLLDMWAVLRQERELASAAGADRFSSDDFRQSRAFRLQYVPWGSHAGVLFEPGAERAMVQWALRAVGQTNVFPALDFWALYGSGFGLLGILLMVPAAASTAARVAGFPASAESTAPPPTAPSAALSLAAWVGATALAAAVATPWTPLKPLHLYGTAYFASVLLLSGVPLALLLAVRRPLPARAAYGAVAGAALAVATVLAVAGCFSWQVSEWSIAPRWARVPFLALALLPICYAEELALGNPLPNRPLGGPRRFSLFLALRTIVWLAMLAAWWSGAASDALLVVIFVFFLALLSVGQRLGADALRRRTASPASAAVFSAILAAWFLAATFPLA